MPDPADPADPADAAGPDPPPGVHDLAERRSEARRARDWPRADALKAEIEAAGWRVIDAGYASRLVPAQAPDVLRNGRVRYGESASVPDRLEAGVEPRPVTVALRVAVPGAEAAEALRSLATDLGSGEVELVVVVDGPDSDDGGEDGDDGGEDAVARVADEVPYLEVIEMARPLGAAGCINAADRYARGAVVVWLGAPDRVPPGDAARLVEALAGALQDDRVAIAGAEGLRSGDLRRWETAPPGSVDAVTLAASAWRREEAVARGPVDERFALDRHLGIWWSLVLRDEGEEREARSAAAVDVPLSGPAQAAPPERDRTERRDFYRIVDRFGHRYDLLQAPAPRRRRDAR